LQSSFRYRRLELFYIKNKEKQMARKKNNKANQNANFNLAPISPLTDTQQQTFDAYDDGKNLVLHGYAGTGKSFISIYLALEEILSGDSEYKKLIVIRSVVPSREMGFLPGNIKEKTRVYEEPYAQIITELFRRGDAYDILKNRNQVEFTTTSFLRGLTFNNCIVIIDEAQNLQYGELYTTLTRVGDNCKVILCGDFRQCDLKEYESKNALFDIINILKSMKSVQFVEFQKSDIVRSGFVKDFIIKSTEYNDRKEA
jgi:phosphate starvation-inducible protein PhoH and related proteins